MPRRRARSGRRSARSARAARPRGPSGRRRPPRRARRGRRRRRRAACAARRGRAREVQLAAGDGIDRAPDRRPAVVVGDAGVAADAADQLVQAARAGFRRQVRVGDQRAGHAHRVGAAVGEQAIGCDRIDDARGGDAGERAGERPGVLGDHVLGDGRRRHDPDRAEVGRRVADRERDVVDALGREQVADPRDALRVGRQPDADAEARDRLAHRPDHRGEEPRPVAPGVVAAVERRVEELLDQVAVRGGDLDPVEAALGGQLGGARMPGDDLVDLAARERARLDAEARARHRRRGERRRARGGAHLLAAAVQELHEQARPVRLHGLGDTPVARGDLGQEAAERVRREQPGRVHRCRLEHDQAGAAARAGLVVGDEVVGRQVVVDERRLVRRRDDPVLQLDRAERERAEQMLEAGVNRRARAAALGLEQRPRAVRLGIARDQHRLGASTASSSPTLISSWVVTLERPSLASAQRTTTASSSRRSSRRKSICSRAITKSQPSSSAVPIAPSSHSSRHSSRYVEYTALFTCP